MKKEFEEKNYMEICGFSLDGDQEMADGTAAVRKRGVKDSETMKVDDFIKYVQEKIASKSEEF